MPSRLGSLSKWSLGVVSFIVMSGCGGWPNGPSDREPPYSWGIHNKSSHRLTDDTAVTYQQAGQTIWCDSGVSGLGGVSTADGGRDPIPEVVHVHWGYQDDLSKHDADVKVHGRIRNEKSFSGTLYLVITDSGVTLNPETFEERSNHAAASEPAS